MHAGSEDWQITVSDSDINLAKDKIRNSEYGTAVALNITEAAKRSEIIQQHDLVISMLPASMHMLVANECLKYKKHLITASYISEEMQQLDSAAKEAGILFLNECGLDPGIDHLSAMKMIDEIKDKGGKILSFKSFCGGLVAPEFDNNPWNYKFTWNPRNVVVAGQATAKYLENGELKFIPQSRIYSQTELISIPGFGDFESYANRDSLGYIHPYGIESAQTVLRGTLRRRGYSANWNNLIKLGLTDDSFTIHDAGKLTYREFVSAFTPGHGIANLEQRVCDFLQIEIESEALSRLRWLGLFDDSKVFIPSGTSNASPAQILQYLLQQKWKLNKGELDMIVMHHEINYELNNRNNSITSSLVVKGEDEVLTAMAKTVGLPMAIAAKLLLKGSITSRGVCMPVTKEFYEPILAELETFGVKFSEKNVD